MFCLVVATGRFFDGGMRGFAGQFLSVIDSYNARC
jgi:hypothetical protein